MTPAEANVWLRKVVRQRKRLLRTRESKVNPMKCAKIVDELTLLLGAYGYKGKEIFRLIYRKRDNIRYIIPGNKGEDTNLKILDQCIREAINQSA